MRGLRHPSHRTGESLVRVPSVRRWSPGDGRRGRVPAADPLHAGRPRHRRHGHRPGLRQRARRRAAPAHGARVAAICSGAFVLAAAGLLNGRRATTHWLHAAELARRFPRIRVDASVLYVEDERIFTSAGTAAGLDLCLELVRRDHGSTVANALARRLVIPPHRDGGQAQYVEAPVPPDSGGNRLANLQEWALQRLDQPLTLQDLADAAHMSTRTLARRFSSALGTTPLQWLLRQRVRRAQELLESSDEPVDRVAALAGFGTAPNLRRHFSRLCRVSPTAYRRAFNQTKPISSRTGGQG